MSEFCEGNSFIVFPIEPDLGIKIWFLEDQINGLAFDLVTWNLSMNDFILIFNPVLVQSSDLLQYSFGNGVVGA